MSVVIACDESRALIAQRSAYSVPALRGSGVDGWSILQMQGHNMVRRNLAKHGTRTLTYYIAFNYDQAAGVLCSSPLTF